MRCRSRWTSPPTIVVPIRPAPYIAKGDYLNIATTFDFSIPALTGGLFPGTAAGEGAEEFADRVDGHGSVDRSAQRRAQLGDRRGCGRPGSEQGDSDPTRMMRRSAQLRCSARSWAGGDPC